MPTKKLTDEEIEEALTLLNQSCTEPWHIDQQGKLARSFTFKNFIDAWSFMTAVAVYSEKVDHHPEWFNVYNRVDVQLTTHDAEGISLKDFDLARFIDSCC